MFAAVVKTIVHNESAKSRISFIGDSNQMETHVRAIMNIGYVKFFEGDGFEMFSYSYRSELGSGTSVSIVTMCDLDNPNGKHVFDSNVDWPNS